MAHRLESHQAWKPGKSQLNTYEVSPYFESATPFVTRFNGANTKPAISAVRATDQLILRAMNTRGMQ